MPPLNLYDDITIPYGGGGGTSYTPDRYMEIGLFPPCPQILRDNGIINKESIANCRDLPEAKLRISAL